MMALSDLARAAAWAGAERVEGHNGRAAVLQRFFRQMYGDSFHIPPELLARARAMDTSGTDDE